MPKRLTTEEFIQKAKQVHSDKYDYSKVHYINSNNKIIIICPEHGEFLQNPNDHLNKHGCSKCMANNNNLKFKKSIHIFLHKATNIHNNKYNYSKVEYINTHTKVCIICPEHGEFLQTPHSHLNNHGCPKCSHKKVGTLHILDSNIFIKNCIKSHNNFYDYSKTNYINMRNDIIVICTKHGEFKINAHSHKNGQGCPKCIPKKSKGELQIETWLNKNNIYFIPQKTFSNCKNKRILPFDFYLPNYNICIEYDGLQHFIPIKYFGGEQEFQRTQLHDHIKNQYCQNNNIKLIRIIYNQNINFILLNYFKSCSNIPIKNFI